MEMADVSDGTPTTDWVADPPAVEPEETRSRWGDFAPREERAVLRSLLRDLSNDDGPLDALDEELPAARAAGLPEQVAKNVREAVTMDPDMTGEDASSVLGGLIEYLYYANRSSLLAKYRLLQPAYRVYADHEANAESPSGTVPASVPSWIGSRWPFLGHRIGFPIGVAASGLTTNAQCVKRLFEAGYNVVTYKTVRSQFTPPHPRPNWALLNSDSIKAIGDPETVVTVNPETTLVEADSSANSFGVPSPEPTVWVDDFRTAAKAAGEGQVLICSVLGEDNNSDHSERSTDVLIADFIAVTRHAMSAGAETVELNLSCPNTTRLDDEPTLPLCYDVELAIAIVVKVRESVGHSVKLGAKLSYLEHDNLARFLDGAAHHLDFVSGINTVAHPVESAVGEGTPYFGKRLVAGIGGAVIQPLALEFVRACKQYKDENNADFAIIGVGGVTDPASFVAMREAGADIVQAVTGVFLNSLLAVDCMRSLGATMRSPLDDAEKERILQTAMSRIPVPEWEFTTSSELPVGVTAELLDELVISGALVMTSAAGAPRYLRSDADSRPSVNA
ncbi:hypothetical protein [Leekyejoonella antrihumi]|nr:hypothetical protein [Leekyejoonella antrihumi]